MVCEDLYKKSMFFKDDMFFFQKDTVFFFKKILAKKHMFFMIDKTKQKLLFENYECFSNKEKKCQELIFAEDTYLGPLKVQVQPVRVSF